MGHVCTDILSVQWRTGQQFQVRICQLSADLLTRFEGQLSSRFDISVFGHDVGFLFGGVVMAKLGVIVLQVTLPCSHSNTQNDQVANGQSRRPHLVPSFRRDEPRSDIWHLGGRGRWRRQLFKQDTPEVQNMVGRQTRSLP
jgi:hypothetical protein